MKSRQIVRFWNLVPCVALLGWIATASALAQEVEKIVEVEEAKVSVSIVDGDDGVMIVEQESRSDEPFLGVVLAPVDRVLRKHLGLEEGKGMLVEKVLEGSPASKAGIEEDDLLLACGGQPVGSTEDLTKALKVAKGKSIAVTLLRGGKELELEATPARRGAGAVGGEKRGIVELEIGQQPFKFNVLQPAIVLKTQLADIPDGLSVTVQKNGDQPATIRAQKGEQVWETTEDKLEVLPDDVRGSVESILRGGFPRFSVQTPGAEGARRILEALKLRELPQPKAPPRVRIPRVQAIPQQPALQPRVLQPVVPGAANPELEKRMEDLQKRLDERLRRLEEQLEKLQKTLEDSAAESSTPTSV